MKKNKRILALLGAVLLLALYLGTLVLSFIDTSLSRKLLQASVAMTILLPILFYAFHLCYRLLNQNKDEE